MWTEFIWLMTGSGNYVLVNMELNFFKIVKDGKFLYYVIDC
jgi:hypothetical protein